MSRDRIIDAARTVLEQEGLHALTIRKVAAEAGLSPMALYRHFEDKSALLNALMQDGLEEWGRIVRAIETKDPMRWLEQLAEAFLEFALTQPHRFDAAFFLPAPKARQYPDDIVAGLSPPVVLAMMRIDQAKVEGRLGTQPALNIVLSIGAAAQGLVSMHRAGRFSSDAQFKTLYRTTMRHCLESFTPITGRSR
jgi:AcrR family transcriptional regulator